MACALCVSELPWAAAVERVLQTNTLVVSFDACENHARDSNLFLVVNIVICSVDRGGKQASQRFKHALGLPQRFGRARPSERLGACEALVVCGVLAVARPSRGTCNGPIGSYAGCKICGAQKCPQSLGHPSEACLQPLEKNNKINNTSNTSNIIGGRCFL